MTLISSIVSPSAGFVSASDIILSAQSPVAPSIDLPLRNRGFSFSKNGRVLCGTAQKTVLFGRTLIQWTGSLGICKGIIQNLYDVSDGGSEYVDLEECFSHFRKTATSPPDIGLIYHYIAENSHVASWTYRSPREKHGDSILHYNGSGLSSYIFNTAITPPVGTNLPAFVLGSAMARAGAHFVREARSDKVYEDWYGGWLEFAWKKKDRFEKLPCAIKLWIIDKDGRLIGSEPYIYSYYVSNQLIISQTKFVKVGNKRKPSQRLISVQDILDREVDGKLDLRNATHKPYVTFHLVMDHSKGDLRALQAFHYNETGFSATLSAEKDVVLQWSETFEDMLRGEVSHIWSAELE